MLCLLCSRSVITRVIRSVWTPAKIHLTAVEVVVSMTAVVDIVTDTATAVVDIVTPLIEMASGDVP